ncbi:ABC transporter substrate-binding protein [Nocardia cerradoensis]|uniref:ABC transporter substrate-binding protein n=1 Tax=Nocardia cerradoensis TaxID=85688 RepID=UPI00030AA13E|nr:ABC transporter substrate-binding protein [Nocardia cerradoensis]NKY43764.1 ABC transporter substrate-binding protein [Nocardia cerradoensis]
MKYSVSGGRKLLAVLAVGAAVLTGGCSSALGGDSGSGGALNSDRTLTLALSRQFTGLNPHNGGSPDSDGSVKGTVYEALTTLDPSGGVHPRLATSWTSPSPLEWRFTLRQGVHFSDGTPLTALDVAWNFAELLDPATKSQLGAQFKIYADSVTAEGADTVVFHLKQPAIDLPSRLWNFYLTTQKFWETGNLNTQALGTGPYVLKSIDLENGAQIEANPEYWGTRPAFPHVKYRVLPSEAARVSAVQAGEVDIALNLDPLSLDQFAGNKDYRSTLSDSSWVQVISINSNKGGPLADIRVRQALNYAIDKKSIISGLLKGAVQPSQGQIIAPPFFQPNPAITAYDYNPDKARALLAEARHANDVVLTLDIPAGTYAAGTAIGQAVVQQAAAVGIKINITETPFPAWLARQNQPSDQAADLVYIGWGAYYKDAWTVFDPFTSKSRYKQSNITDTVFDDLVNRLQAATDPGTARDLANQATQRYHDQAHTVFLWPGTFTSLVRNGLTWAPRTTRYLYAQEVGRA